MRLAARRTTHQAHLLALALALAPALLGLGCGEASLELQLDQLPADNPYSGLAELEATVSRAGEVLVTQRKPFSSAPLQLSPVPRGDDLSVSIVGYDGDGDVLARGAAEPEMPEWDGACCVLVCFCSLALFESGQCDCGDATCREQCQRR